MSNKGSHLQIPTNDITAYVPHESLVQDGMRKTGFDGLWMVLLVAAAVYVILAAAHIILLPLPAKWVMVTIAGLTALIFLVSSWWVRRRPGLYIFSYPIWFSFFSLCQFNGLVHLYFDPQPHQTTNLILINIALGIALFSSRWVALFYSLTTAIWLGLALMAPPSDQWIHFFFAYFEGLVIGILVHVIRKRNVRDHFLKEIYLEQQNRALKEARKAAETAAQAKAVFLASMSHELRTPLNAIIGYSEIIQADLLKHAGLKETLRDVDGINQAGRHLLSVINDVLNLAKIESDQVTLELKQVRLADLIDEVVQTTLPLMQKNKNQLYWPDVDEKVTITTDPLKLKQILFNIMGNAAKFTINGRVDLLIKIDEQQQSLTFKIQDTGIGIEAYLLDRLFEPFWQADGSFSRQFEGTGLGLTISDQFCRLLGGEITVESKIGMGSTFCVRIPLRSTN